MILIHQYYKTDSSYQAKLNEMVAVFSSIFIYIFVLSKRTKSCSSAEYLIIYFII